MRALDLLAAQATHPQLPADATWVGVLVIAIGALFLAAAIIGPIIRLNSHPLPPDSFPRHPHS